MGYIYYIRGGGGGGGVVGSGMLRSRSIATVPVPCSACEIWRTIRFLPLRNLSIPRKNVGILEAVKKNREVIIKILLVAEGEDLLLSLVLGKCNL